MPPENLPEGAKRIYEAAEASARKGTCKESGERKDECANRVAWAAVKKKYKKVGDKWVRKAETFSMAITNTSYDKSTDTRRWKAVASDIEDDLFEDNMTLELYGDFLERIESKEQPPESFRSDFWSGGIPYLSVSHYPDLNGKGVPGPVDVVYIDGDALKASGRFNDTPIGKEVFKAISKDFSDNIPNDEKIRISIAFLDWMHRHKSNGYVFDRAKSEEPICPECLKELLTGEAEGKEFLRGHLVHLALTRVPVNTRTSMEVERSMTTRKDDAASIVGDELAEELEEEAQMVDKSEALVIKSEDELEEKREKPSDYEEEEEDEEKEKKKKKEEKSEVVEESPDLQIDLLKEIKAAVTDPVHPLDIAFAELKAVYDEAVELSDVREALLMVQEPFEALAAIIQDGMVKEEVSDESRQDTSIVDAITQALAPFSEELGLLRAELSTLRSQPQDVIPDNAPPIRRSFAPSNLILGPETEEKSETPNLRAIARRSVGLDN